MVVEISCCEMKNKADLRYQMFEELYAIGQLLVCGCCGGGG